MADGWWLMVAGGGDGDGDGDGDAGDVDARSAGPFRPRGQEGPRGLGATGPGAGDVLRFC
eukprot:11177681-Lingulodinium_polyedra.AAC.1